MRRTEQVQGLRLMKFAEVYGRTHRGGLSQAEAAEVLGVSERTFRRWHFRSPPAATAAITSRPGSASTNTPTAQWPSSMDRDVWRDTTPMANLSTAKPARPRDPLRRDRAAPCGQVDSRSAPDHFPTGPATPTEAVNSYGT